MPRMEKPQVSSAPTYTCEECEGVFEYGWDDDQAHEEALKRFGKDGHDPDMAIVCDDCYKRLTQ